MKVEKNIDNGRFSNSARQLEILTKHRRWNHKPWDALSIARHQITKACTNNK